MPTCLPIVLRCCHLCAAVRFRASGEFPLTANRKPPGTWLPGAQARTDRPAWQSPYGPPPHRAHRGRWTPAQPPVTARPRPALRSGHLCGRCD